LGAGLRREVSVEGTIRFEVCWCQRTVVESNTILTTFGYGFSHLFDNPSSLQHNDCERGGKRCDLTIDLVEFDLSAMIQDVASAAASARNATGASAEALAAIRKQSESLVAQSRDARENTKQVAAATVELAQGTTEIDRQIRAADTRFRRYRFSEMIVMLRLTNSLKVRIFPPNRRSMLHLLQKAPSIPVSWF
jgi:hypothetical protein